MPGGSSEGSEGLVVLREQTVTVEVVVWYSEESVHYGLEATPLSFIVVTYLVCHHTKGSCQV